MQKKIEVVMYGTCFDAVRKGMTLLNKDMEYKKVSIEVKPTKTPKLNKIIIIYELEGK